MYKKSILKRLSDMGVSRLILSWDTFIGVIVIFSTYIITGGDIPQSSVDSMLNTIILVSASIFSIVLAGLALVTSFSDKLFIYAWQKIGEYDNLITTFQYNLYIPLFLIMFATILNFVYYSSLAMIFLVAVFSYMIVSLVDLVNFIAKYGLQRGEFVRQEIEKGARNQNEKPAVTEDELENMLARIEELSDKVDDD